MPGKITLDRIGEMVKTVLVELRDAGGKARIRDLLRTAAPKLDLNEHEKATHEKTGSVRWRSLVHFYSIDCVKAGYLQKSSGTWTLTKEGEEALKKPAADFMRDAQRKYRAWKRAQRTSESEGNDVADEDSDVIVHQVAYDQAVEQARAEIEDHIGGLGPYDFQKLVSELLTAMGYHVPYVAPPGPDGGIDIVAYKDPLGTSTPRIRAQIKHRQQKVTVKEVRELEGLLRKEGDIGLIVSSGGFTSDAEREVRASTRHIETMDLDRLIRLWQQHYENIREPGKVLLPLVKVYFLAPTEE